MRPRSPLGWFRAAAVLVLAGLLALVLVWALGSMGSYPLPQAQSVAENDEYDVALGVAILSGVGLLALGTLTAAALALLHRAQRAKVSTAGGLSDPG